MAENRIDPKLSHIKFTDKLKWGTKSGVYYYLGNISSHLTHALPIYKKIGGTFIVSSISAYNYCVKSNVSVVVIDDRPDVFLQSKQDDLVYTVKYINENAQAVFMYDVFSISKYIKAPQILLTHGNSFKNYYISWRQKLITCYRLIASLGPFNEAKIIKQGVSKKQVLKVGPARCDWIIKSANQTKKRRFVAKKLGLDSRKKIISYMPTWWGPTSVNDIGKLIARFVPEEYSFIFRPHPDTPPELLDEYLSIIESEKLNAAYVPDGKYEGVDINAILSASSIFIGDMSSVVLDALLTDKPIMFAFGGELRAQKEDVYLPIKEIYDASEHITFQNVNSLSEMISCALAKPVRQSVRNKSKRRIFYGLDGSNTQMTIEALKKVITHSVGKSN